MTYGTTIKLNSNFDFEINALSKSILLVSDLDNLAQSTNLLLNINTGEIKFAPTFGTQINKIIGSSTQPHYIEYIISKSIIKDPRIMSIVSMTITKDTGTVTINTKVRSNENAIVDLRGIIIW